jgi:hypothetical protein
MDALYPAHGDYAVLAVVNAVSADSLAAIHANAAAFTADEAADDDDDPVNRTKWEAERVWEAGVLRDIFGNPFRPVAIDPAWQTPAVISLARAISQGRSFDRMPELVGALEDSGCHDAEILSHCRMPTGHVRGCWVIDAMLD